MEIRNVYNDPLDVKPFSSEHAFGQLNNDINRYKEKYLLIIKKEGEPYYDLLNDVDYKWFNISELDFDLFQEKILKTGLKKRYLCRVPRCYATFLRNREFAEHNSQHIRLPVLIDGNSLLKCNDKILYKNRQRSYSTCLSTLKPRTLKTYAKKIPNNRKDLIHLHRIKAASLYENYGDIDNDIQTIDTFERKFRQSKRKTLEQMINVRVVVENDLNEIFATLQATMDSDKAVVEHSKKTSQYVHVKHNIICPDQQAVGGDCEIKNNRDEENYYDDMVFKDVIVKVKSEMVDDDLFYEVPIVSDIFS